VTSRPTLADEALPTGRNAASPQADARASDVPRAGDAAPGTSDRSGLGVIRRLGPFGILAAITVSVPVLGGYVMLYYRQPVAEWLAAQSISGLLLFLGCYVLLVGLALLPCNAGAMISGYAFHFPIGFSASLLGMAGASLVGYLMGRAAGGNRAMSVLRDYPRMLAVRNALVGSGFWRALLTVSLVRLPPNVPFAATNLCFAGAHVPLGAFLLGTALGMAPRLAFLTYIGAHLRKLSDDGAPWWYFWVGVLLTLAVLAILGHVVSRGVTRATVPATDR
jgi:uncharacterized membrane protein YdjX (TVP38/TMEM64 family)